MNEIFKDLAMLVHEQGEVIGKLSTHCHVYGGGHHIMLDDVALMNHARHIACSLQLN